MTRVFVLTAGDSPEDAIDAVERRGYSPLRTVLFEASSVATCGASEIEPEQPSEEDVVRRISHAHRVAPSDVRGPRRLAELVRARVAISKALRAAGHSLPEIGRALGGRDHTSVMYYLGMRSSRYKRISAPGVRRVG